MYSLFARFSEASTHAGLAAIMQAAKYLLPAPWALVLDAATGLFGALAVAIPGSSQVTHAVTVVTPPAQPVTTMVTKASETQGGNVNPDLIG